jgi:hypothetical protein
MRGMPKRTKKDILPLICSSINDFPISTNKGSDASRRYVQHHRGLLSTVNLNITEENKISEIA